MIFDVFFRILGMPLGVISARFPHLFPINFQVHFLGVTFEKQRAPAAEGGDPGFLRKIWILGRISASYAYGSPGLARRILRASPPAAGPPP